MASTLEFLEARVVALEKKFDFIVDKLQGSVSEAAVQRLLALRQAEITALQQDVESLKTIISNYLKQP